MKKFAVLLCLLLVLALMFSGCSGYSSSYKAFLLVRSQQEGEASVSFSSLEGRLVQKIKCKEGQVRLTWSAELEEGKMTVSYDNRAGKAELFTIEGGETTESFVEIAPGTVYLILETAEVCKEGKFKFALQ